MKKKIKLIYFLMLACLMLSDFVYADVSVNFPTQSPGMFTNVYYYAFQNAYATFAIVVQVLAIGAVVFAGLRYMFAAADKKADIKRRIDLAGYRCNYCVCYIVGYSDGC